MSILTQSWHDLTTTLPFAIAYLLGAHTARKDERRRQREHDAIETWARATQRNRDAAKQ